MSNEQYDSLLSVCNSLEKEVEDLRVIHKWNQKKTEALKEVLFELLAYFCWIKAQAVPGTKYVRPGKS